MATGNPGTIGGCGDLLVDILLAVVAGRPVTQLDEIFHASYSLAGPDKVLVRRGSGDTMGKTGYGRINLPGVVRSRKS
jgi:hypothetical protein